MLAPGQGSRQSSDASQSGKGEILFDTAALLEQFFDLGAACPFIGRAWFAPGHVGAGVLQVIPVVDSKLADAV